ncbi:MAG: MarR family transcriptional regulator [Candidatus Omnitrophota bacterium]
MTQLSLSEFADRITEMHPVIMREFYKHDAGDFYKIRITLPQLVIVNALAREGELRMTDLARSMNVTTAAMTGIIDRLVRDGYVKRAADADDRRTVKVGVTPKGIKVARNAAEHHKKLISRLFSVISQPEREEYLRILTIIRDHLIGDKADN